MGEIAFFFGLGSGILLTALWFAAWEWVERVNKRVLEQEEKLRVE
jgi:hypothetical protein